MKIGIIGCGWLGFPLAKKLLKTGYEVNGSTTSMEKLKMLSSAGINAFHISLQENNIEGAIDKFLECDTLVINIPPRRNTPATDTYPRQMELLKKEIVKSTIKNVIFISSTSVYPAINGIVTEDTPVDPVRKSGKAVSEAESILRNEPLTFTTTILRFSGLIGPDRNPGRFLAGKKELAGANSPVNLIHLHDCIAMIEYVINKNWWGEILNGASPDHPTRKEYYTLAAKKLNLPAPEFIEDQKNDYKIVDGSRIEKTSDFRYQHRDLIQSLMES